MSVASFEHLQFFFNSGRHVHFLFAEKTRDPQNNLRPFNFFTTELTTEQIDHVYSVY